MYFKRLGRRGQIRGIDFAIALIIYILVLTQIIILTNNVIQSNYQVSQLSEQTALTDNIFDQFVSFPGSTGWEDLDVTGIPDWQFGLASETNNRMIDPNKLGRLANNTNATYGLTYDSVFNSVENLTKGKSFKIATAFTITNTIDTVSVSTNQLTVNGTVLKGEDFINATVNIYGIYRNQIVSTSFEMVDENFLGIYDVTLNFGADVSAENVIVVTIAEYGTVNQAADYRFIDGAGSFTKVSLAVEEQRNGVPSLLSTANENSGTFNHYAMFISPSEAISDRFSTGAGTTSSESLDIPSVGILVVLALNTDGSSYGITTFPLAMDDNFSEPFGPDNEPRGSSSQVLTKNILSRGVLLQCIVTIWNDA